MSWHDPSELSLTELQNLENMLKLKLEKLKQHTPTEDSVLSESILKFIQSLVKAKITVRMQPHYSVASPYLANSVNSAPVQHTYSYSTICTNCKAKNPTHTHCAHAFLASDE